MEPGHLSTFWDSELLLLFGGCFEAVTALQYVIYLGWWHLGMFKLEPYVYVLNTRNIDHLLKKKICCHPTSSLLSVWFV